MARTKTAKARIMPTVGLFTIVGMLGLVEGLGAIA